jgi:hypothetical protein
MPTEPTATPAGKTPLEEIGNKDANTWGSGNIFGEFCSCGLAAHGNLEEHIEDIIGNLVPALGTSLPIARRHLALMMCNIWLFRIA